MCGNARPRHAVTDAKPTGICQVPARQRLRYAVAEATWVFLWAKYVPRPDVEAARELPTFHGNGR